MKTKVIFLAGLWAAAAAMAEPEALRNSAWNGFDRIDFAVDGRAALLVAPKAAAPGKPWIWRTEFFGHEPQADVALLGKGFHVAYINVQNLYGAPVALDAMDAFYAHLTRQYELSSKPVLEGFSRGGLFAFNWAARHPDRVGCLYVDAPVCDFKSWPGGKGKSKGSPKDWQRLLGVYGFTNETQALVYPLNPVDNLAPLAKARIPILSVCGAADKTVPMDENTRLVEQRYKALGGEIEVIAKPNCDHHPHSLKDPTPIVEFILKHVAPSAAEAGKQNPATDWMHTAKIGAFMHFLPNAKNFKVVDQFDVAAVTKQLADSGVRYFVITLGQNSGYMNSPNATYDKIAGYAPGERCSKRDLPRELAAALKPYGIRLMLYLPCQTPNQDLQAAKAFGLLETPLNHDRKINPAFAERWASVIREWSDRYGTAISGWWFDGGYAWIGFNSEIARLYAAAAKHGNPQAVVTFNPGVGLKRWTDAEDYTAGELNEPFKQTCNVRWLDGSQWHALTFLGKNWGKREPRYADTEWIAWVRAVTTNGGVVTLDAGPNYDASAAPVGTFSDAQLKQLRAITDALR